MATRGGTGYATRVWSLDPRDGAARALGAAAYLAAVIVFLLLQEVGLKLRRAEHRDWWAGAGRDLFNAAGLVAVAGALRLVGLSWPAALLVGGTLTLVLFGATVFFATRAGVAHPRAWSLATGLALAVPVLLWTAEVLALISAAASRLFAPGGS